MRHRVSEIRWHSPSSRPLGCEGNIRHGFVLVHNGGLDATVLVGVVDEIVEETVGHVAREDGGLALGGHAFKGSNAAIDQVRQATPLREPHIGVTVFYDGRGEVLGACDAVGHVVPVDGCGCWGSGEVGCGAKFKELVSFGELLRDEALQDGQVGDVDAWGGCVGDFLVEVVGDGEGDVAMDRL